jgi:formyltetrahydrofolate-dependent phosphoribosylglycinamide formyltransferase
LNICIFASGNGSNFKSIYRAHRKGKIKSNIKLLITNNSSCGAALFAKKYKIPCEHISSEKYDDNELEIKMTSVLIKHKIDFIVLAGYMKKLPDSIVNKYQDRIINIHPALLPSFGGKGMYGLNVHKAVLESGVRYSGLTIHYVDNEYDNGRIIFQKSVKIDDEDTPETLQEKILKQEHIYYPKIIAELEKNYEKKSIN